MWQIRYSLLSLTYIVALACTVPSIAAEKSGVFEIEEVIVTAQRKESKLQDVAIAVSSFSADQLAAGQTETLGDLQGVVPNLSIHVGDANNAVAYIRGIGQIDSIAFFEPGVGIYLDDVYLGRAQGAFLDVLDVARIEVLRGPQGSLYGRNTVGGAIKFISAAPTQELTGSISATVGNYGRQDLKANISGPISDSTGFRLTAAKLGHDGYADNQLDRNEDGDRDVRFLRAVLDTQFSDRFSGQFSVDYSDGSPNRSRTPAKETPITLTIVDPFTFGISQETFPADVDPFKVNVDFNTTEFTETIGYNLNLTWDFSDELSLKSISSYRQLEYGTEIDLDGTPRNAFGIYYFNDQDQISQELQLNYQTNRLSVVSGVYYYKEDGDTFDGGVFSNFLIALSGEATFETKSTAVYGQIDYDLTEKLSLIAGFRYTEEDKDYARHIEDFDLTALAGIQFDPVTFSVSYANPELLNPSSADLGLNGGVGVARTPANPETADFENFSPKLGFQYHISTDANVYATASTGFKSGGFNGRVADGQLDPYDEETLTSYEVGLKTKLWDNRIRLNTAIFYNQYDDLQVSTFEATPGGGGLLPVFSNAGEATMQGAELELVVLLAEHWRINLNIGYLDAEYKEFLAGADAINSIALDISDERHLVNAPEWDTFVGITYETELSNWGHLTLTTDAAYRSKTYLEVNSSENLAQGGYTVINAAAIFDSADEHWQVILGGKNLGDKEYRTHAFDLAAFPGVQLGYYNPPKTLNLAVKYKF